MEDELLSIMFSKESRASMIEHGVKKRIDRNLLTTLTSPEALMYVASMIASGEYHIAPPYIGEIPKDDGTMRKVCINTPLDRLVLSMANNALFKKYGHMIHPHCVSYKKGVGVHKIIKEVVNNACNGKGGYIADLSKYFDSVNRETLNKAFDDIDDGSPVIKMLREYHNEDLIIDENGELIEKYKSLAQGSADSAFLANFVLRDIDEAICSKVGLYYRYSDDILIMGDNAEQGLEMLREMLESKGLALNPKKIKRIDKDTPFTFLGFKIQGDKVTFSQKSINKFKDGIREITKVTGDTKIKNKATIRKAIKKINNYMYLSYIKNKDNFGWGEYFYKTCNVEEDIRMLDEFVKDHLKHMWTGKWNHTTNRNKVPNEVLRELGYVSMVKLFKNYKIDVDMFRMELYKM